MNKVVTINLGGMAYQLEEDGYDALRAYLESAAARLQFNPDREEILTDIEWAIGEKFRALLGNHKTVVVSREVAAVLAAMGPIEAEPGEASSAGAGAAGTPGGAAGPGAAKTGPPPPSGDRPPKRLYRIREGDMLAGVCNGLAAYVGIDPTFVRLAFVFLTLMWGTGLLVYVVLAFVVPEATTPAEKAAATGDPATTQEFIRRAKAGYYEARKAFPDRQARREWKRRFQQEMRAHRERWRHHWQECWMGPAPVHPGLGLTLPLLSLLHGAVKILWLCALVSLLATGAVFGLALPANLPLWVAVVLLIFLYGIFAGPLKAARRACQWGLGRARPAWALIFLVDAAVWLAVAVTLFCLACHYYPELSAAAGNLPDQAHKAADDLRNWWHAK